MAAAVAWLEGPREIAIVGNADDPRTHALRRVAFAATSPGAIVVVGAPGDEHPLLAGRDILAGAPTAYVCRHFTCDAPVTEPSALATTVGARLRRSSP